MQVEGFYLLQKFMTEIDRNFVISSLQRLTFTYKSIAYIIKSTYFLCNYYSYDAETVFFSLKRMSFVKNVL